LKLSDKFSEELSDGLAKDQLENHANLTKAVSERFPNRVEALKKALASVEAEEAEGMCAIYLHHHAFR
jgi:uncharacterized protein YjgD (DUF1641 family)